MLRTTYALTPVAVAITALCSSPLFAQNDASIRTDEQMVVTATHTEVSTTKAPASISVITEEDILSEPGLALNDFVKNIAGVESQMDGGRAGREMISIRGMDSGFTMILVNGRKMSSSNAVFRGNDFDLSAIPKESIQRIEVIRGPMSALYGSEALGGVINVITKKPTNEWNSQISGDYGYRDDDGGSEYTAGFTTSGALLDDQLFMSLSMNKSSRDAWKPFSGDAQDEDGNTYDRSLATALEQRDTLTASGSLLWYINNDHDLAFDFTYADDQRDGVIESTSGLTDSEAKVKRNTQALTYNGSYDWGDALLRYNRDAIETQDNFNSKNPELGFYDINEINQSIDGHGTTELANHTVTFGGELRYTELKNPDSLTVTGDENVSQQALFVQDQWMLSEKDTLTYGTRVDMHENFGTHWSPRAYLVHSATNNWTIKGGVGTAFKAPSLTQLSEQNIINSCKGGCLLVGNPDLQPETSTNYEISTSYVETFWSVEFGLFQNNISNLIDRDLDNAVGTEPDGRDIYTYKNIDEAVIQGAELSAEYDFTSSIRMNGTYTHLATEDKSTGNELENRPDHTAMARLIWEPIDALSTFARVNYTSQTLISVDDNVYRPAYVTADLGLNYLVNTDWRLRAGVKNVTNVGFDDLAITQRGYVITPRNWYVGTTLNF
ncbi:TonB-dependent receptor [Vibrio sp. 10N.286.49.C2]|uniref:TonB-dependent receptor domain-containing protein n=1 Tax=unclassified Vibrio TaxID=2614977 RepID=UPI000C847A8B|nr:MULTISPECIES: TonB-dependent receptor [unclassified Vibrio]PMH42801.1 TonB-dependent receptor [Vibrio sp. 10N.286.49.C2]PMH53861.1 TonB-dependent receptor [Vibrio sp. 10N.286.49.B1]PMH81637.1 TonB-dependent receptor [Vibrio sp. 10N.286.48.B7]